MGHATIATYIRPGHPREYATESGIGNTWVYRGPSATISANKPVIGETWADGRPVVACEIFEISAASELTDMMVVTAINTSAGVTIATTTEEVVYELEWRPVLRPLEVHPDFRTGGTYALDATAKKDIMGWRAEVSPSLKANRKYRELDSEQIPSGTETTITGNALEFIKLLEIGQEEYVDYMPVWRKRSLYKGTNPPSTGAIGVKGTPSGSGYPSGYEWVKSRDSAVRIGRKARWQRDEEWEGAITVYADKSDVFPPA